MKSVCPSIGYGINVPNFGDYHRPRVLADLAASAEEAGWDGFFIWDHMEGEMPFCDTTVALSAIALQTPIHSSPSILSHIHSFFIHPPSAR